MASFRTASFIVYGNFTFVTGVCQALEADLNKVLLAAFKGAEDALQEKEDAFCKMTCAITKTLEVRTDEDLTFLLEGLEIIGAQVITDWRMAQASNN